MEDILQNFILKDPSFRIVLDGLDECEPSDRHQLLQICGRLARLCKVAILSRDIEEIAGTVTKLSKSVKYGYIHIMESHNKGDIESFVRRRVQEDFEHLGLSALLLDTIFHTLSNGAHGMFLWVKLMIDQLATQTSVKKIKMTLQNLPDGLDQTYEGILEQTPDKDMAKQLLRWITYANRPLTVKELDYAITIEPGELELDIECLTLKPKETFRKVLGPLIEIDDNTETVKFIHASVKDFLSGAPLRSSKVSEFFDKPQAAHQWLTRSSLTYLTMERQPVMFGNDWDRNVMVRSAYFKDHALLQYSYGNWWLHVRDSIQSNERLSQDLEDDILKFSRSRSIITRWAQVLRYCLTNSEKRGQAQQILSILDTFPERFSVKHKSFQDLLKYLHGDEESSSASALA